MKPLMTALSLLLVACGGAQNTGGMSKPPTEKEVTDYLTKVQQESAMTDPVRPATKAETQVTDIKIGDKIKKQVGRGEEAREVWAVKAHAFTKIFLKNGSEQTRDMKLDEGEAWFFYRDAFGEWTAKHGPM